MEPWIIIATKVIVEPWIIFKVLQAWRSPDVDHLQGDHQFAAAVQIVKCGAAKSMAQAEDLLNALHVLGGVKRSLQEIVCLLQLSGGDIQSAVALFFDP